MDNNPQIIVVGDDGPAAALREKLQSLGLAVSACVSPGQGLVGMVSRMNSLERGMATLLRCVGEAILAIDNAGKVSFMNPVAETLTGWPSRRATGQSLNAVFRLQESLSPQSPIDLFLWKLQQGKVLDWTGESTLIHRDGKAVPIHFTASPLRDEDGKITGGVLVFRDCTEQRKAEVEREQLIQKLQAALEEVKMLSGLLPICAQCKKIRDDQGYWQQVEVFLSDHSDLRFSHGLCPDCLQRLYPEIAPGVLRAVRHRRKAES